MKFLWLFILAALIVGCGGGGGGGTTNGGTAGTVVGRVILVDTGSSPVPAATVQIGDKTTLTDLSDGSFSIAATSNDTSILVVYRPSAQADPITFRFDLTVASGTNDVGDLWVGPQKVSVQGRVLDAATSAGLGGATLRFAGRTAVSAADGRFTLNDVAYASSNLASFLGIEGRASKTGYLSRSFFANDGATGGIVLLDDIRLTSESSEEPPPAPFTIEGFITPANLAPGTVVTLISGGIPVRQTTIVTGNRYSFFVKAGTYVLKFNNPTNGKTAPDAPVTLADENVPIRQDANLQ